MPKLKPKTCNHGNPFVAVLTFNKNLDELGVVICQVHVI
jgi:hypothetical protein